MDTSLHEQKNIVIIGAGFGGVTTTLKLAACKKYLRGHRIILIDKNPYQLYTPALYEIAAIPRHDANVVALRHAITIALKDIVAGKKITFIQGEVVALDQKNKKIILRGKSPLHYEFLIFALGAETNYFNIPGLQENALPLKTFSDGVALRNRIEKLIEEKMGIVRIVIGGGGATGIELAAEFMTFLCRLQKIYKKEAVCAIEVSIIEASGEILPGFSQWVTKKARERLEKIGVFIKTNTLIVSITSGEIQTRGEAIPYDLLIWAGGISGPRILENFSLPLNKKGQIEVNKYLEASERIFAIGDNASFLDNAEKPLPSNIPIAEREGRMTAKNIVRIIRKKEKKPYRAQNHYPYILTVGQKYAIADLVVVRFAGFFGWLAKQLVELRYLLFILPPHKAIPMWLYTIKIYSSND